MNDLTIKLPSQLFNQAEILRFEGLYSLDILSIHFDEYHFSSPLKWYVDVTNTGTGMLLSGNVYGEGICACARCLDDTTFVFDASVEDFFVFSKGEEERDEEEEDFFDQEGYDPLPEDHLIDLEPILKAALFLEAPEKPLCSKDCAGLCPHCGINLNKESCSCSKDDDINRKNNPFSVLRNYKFDS